MQRVCIGGAGVAEYVQFTCGEAQMWVCVCVHIYKYYDFLNGYVATPRPHTAHPLTLVAVHVEV